MLATDYGVFGTLLGVTDTWNISSMNKVKKDSMSHAVGTVGVTLILIDVFDASMLQLRMAQTACVRRIYKDAPFRDFSVPRTVFNL